MVRSPTGCLPSNSSRCRSKKARREIRLPLRLPNWRGHSYLLTSIHAAPLISTRVVGPDPHLFGHRLALDDEQPPAMHEQMIDLAHASGAIVLRLGVIFEPQVV